MSLFEHEICIPVSEAALFLDLDGTLAPIAPLPELVRPDPLRTALLRHIGSALGGRLAIVSGRTIDDVDRVLDGEVACVAGLHGLERRVPSRRIETTNPHPDLAKTLTVIQAFAQSRPSLLVEDKGLAIAIHYRQVPEAAGDVLAFARRIAWATGLKLQEGHMVAELRSPGANKGDVLDAFMQEKPFVGHTPIFVGDDLTDEDGFAGAEKMGGRGVLVASSRATLASGRLPGVSEVLRWLGQALESQAFRLMVKA